MLIDLFDNVFSAKFEKSIKIGLEMEVYVIDMESKTLNNDDELTRDIYTCFDERVFRDYYPYQLEIRTSPHEDPKEVYNEFINLFEEANRVAKDHGYKLVPVSYLDNAMYCGMHVHVSYKPYFSKKELVKTIVASYPFMLDIARLSLSSPTHTDRNGLIYSKRIYDSIHVATPPISYTFDRLVDLWTDIDNSSRRYYDIILNTNRRYRRYRIKDVDTIEIRIFDSVGDKKALYDILNLTYNVFKYINNNWIQIYRKTAESRTALYRSLSAIRYLMLLPKEYINPLTGTNAQSLAEFFRIPLNRWDTWITYWIFDLDIFSRVSYQTSINYLIS